MAQAMHVRLEPRRIVGLACYCTPTDQIRAPCRRADVFDERRHAVRNSRRDIHRTIDIAVQQGHQRVGDIASS